MGLFRSLSGSVRAELVSADIAAAITAIRKAGIELLNVEQVDSLTFSFDLRRNDIQKIQTITQRRGDSFRLLRKDGIYWTMRGLLRRPVLVIGLAILLLFALMTPSRVLFVRVEGNSSVPTRLILEEAANCGITLGASTRNVRSEQVKNNLLSKIDALQWAGINTYGCVAVISVKERAQEPKAETQHSVSSIVARRDGIVLSIVTEQGTALCKPGDAVVTGQKLISGYTDCGIAIQATQAKGEITALTEHEITALMPTNYQYRVESAGQKQNYALIIGKNRINFYKGSGILDTSCVRIYLEWYVTLPGGFVLPIGVACERYVSYETAETQEAELFDRLASYTRDYVLQQTRAGEIVASTETTEESDGIFVLHGHYACRELLGITRIEEKLEEYGKDP